MPKMTRIFKLRKYYSLKYKSRKDNQDILEHLTKQEGTWSYIKKHAELIERSTCTNETFD